MAPSGPCKLQVEQYLGILSSLAAHSMKETYFGGRRNMEGKNKGKMYCRADVAFTLQMMGGIGTPNGAEY